MSLNATQSKILLDIRYATDEEFELKCSRTSLRVYRLPLLSGRGTVRYGTVPYGAVRRLRKRSSDE